MLVSAVVSVLRDIGIRPDSKALAVVPRDIVSDMWENVGSLPTVADESKDTVHLHCRNMCVVTGSSKKLKVAHIIPKKVFREKEALELLEWAPYDVNSVVNLLLMQDEVEQTFDNRLWCFVPALKAPLGCRLCGHPLCLENTTKGCQMHTQVKYTPFLVKELVKGALGTNNGKVVFLPTYTSRHARLRSTHGSHDVA